MFSLYGWNMGVLSAMAKEKVDYDAERATAAATDLETLANLGQSGLWPQGSDNAASGNAETRALPAIWEKYPDITEKAMALREATAALTLVAGNGLDALQGAIGDVGGACKACHDDYRAKKE